MYVVQTLINTHLDIKIAIDNKFKSIEINESINRSIGKQCMLSFSDVFKVFFSFLFLNPEIFGDFHAVDRTRTNARTLNHKNLQICVHDKKHFNNYVVRAPCVCMCVRSSLIVIKSHLAMTNEVQIRSFNLFDMLIAHK